MKIGLLSDTHSYYNTELNSFFENCDQIWHAGDIGEIEVIKELEKLGKELKIVYGNIDNNIIRTEFKEYLYFKIEDKYIFITHIGGKPNNYFPNVLSLIKDKKVDIFICGHSHILKVQYDKKNKFLYMNPGAAGNYGIHKISTALRFEINGDTISNLEIIELKRNN